MVTTDELKALLDYHDDLYYNQDDPILSDEEYDALKIEYLRQKLMDDVIGENFVPGEASSKFEKVKHLHGVKSLGKINSDAEVKQFIEKFEYGDVTLKLDGLTVVVYGEGTYSDKAVWATRGNGIEGEDVSATCAMVPGLKSIPGIVYRCEVFMPIAEFERINKEREAQGLKLFKNPRNAAAGMIRNSDPNKVQGLKYLAYRIMNSTAKHTDQIELLKLHGIATVPYVSFNSSNFDKAYDFVVTYADKYRSKLEMEIDGLVISSNVINSLEKYGETGHHPNDSVAYKFPSQGQWSTLRDVLWQVGRTGQVSPVAVFDGVDILGSTVTRATLHNMKYIDALNLYIGSPIFVIKANDVIPRVAKVGVTENVCKKIHDPTHCPVCHSVLRKSNDTLFCHNTNCSAKIIAQVAHMCGKDALNVDGLSTKTIEKLFDLGMLNSRYDIFDLTESHFLKVPGFAAASAKKLYNTIRNSISDVPFDKFLYATGVPLLGRHASRDIAKTFINLRALREDLNDNFQQLDKIHGVGETLVENMSTHWGMVDQLARYCTISYKAQAPRITPTNGVALNFVITGALYNGTRNDYETKITSMGHSLQSSVTKKTNYLVTNEQTMTSKRQKAMQLGVPIISESELLALL